MNSANRGGIRSQARSAARRAYDVGVLGLGRLLGETRSHVLLGSLYERARFDRGARLHFERVLAKDPNHPRAQHWAQTRTGSSLAEETRRVLDALARRGHPDLSGSTLPRPLNVSITLVVRDAKQAPAYAAAACVLAQRSRAVEIVLSPGLGDADALRHVIPKKGLTVRTSNRTEPRDGILLQADESPVEVPLGWPDGVPVPGEPWSGDLDQAALGRVRGHWTHNTATLCARALDLLDHPAAALPWYGASLELDSVNPHVLDWCARAMVRAEIPPSRAFASDRFDVQPCDVSLARWTQTATATEWFNDLERAGDALAGRERVGLLACYSWLVPLSLALAVILLRAGHRVNLYWLPLHRAEREDEAFETALLESEMQLLAARGLHRGLEVIDLRQVVPTPLEAEANEMLELQSRIDTQIHLETPSIDLDREDDAAHFAFRMARNRDFGERFETVLRGAAPDRWIFHNGAAVEYGVAHALTRMHDIPDLCFEFDARANQIIIAANKPFGEVDIDEAWRRRTARGVTTDERDEILRRAVRMEKPDYYGDTWIEAFQSASPSERVKLFENLDLDPERPIALLLPNIDFDTVVLVDCAHTIFAGPREWVFETIDYYCQRPELQLVIRLHPLERRRDASRGIKTDIDARWPVLPRNIRLIGSDEPINTYSLMQIADLGLCYASDAGLEMVMRGKPVIHSGRARPFGRGIGLDPETPAEYYRWIERLSESRGELEGLEDMRERAVLLAKLLWDDMHKPFPWRPGGVVGQLRARPFAELLDPSALEEYREAFGAMTGSIEVYDGMLGLL